MDTRREEIIKLVPAIRMIMSTGSLMSGCLIPMDRLNTTDPEKISRQLGESVRVLRGDTATMTDQVMQSYPEPGAGFFIEELGLLLLSENRSAVEQHLAGLRKDTRQTGLSAGSTVPPVRPQLYNKIIAITGGAMGYGEGIARALFSEGANVVLLDINEDAGKAVAADLNNRPAPQRAHFIKTDVTSLDSVIHAVYETVLEFSGLDVMISNAGVLKAGGIGEMDPGSFDFVTSVNYKGYFNCVKASVPVMKAQNRYNGENFGDIIQINSKSGLQGSKKNFAYAGSKFAGIGLTQSFAMELMGDRIKVNSICPGNFFEGPLWSDPEKGLFIQYLNAGKVAGAKTIADVKRHYESLVPAGRGCRIGDVVKAIKYVIDQEYETGQAIPVTGGQVMLS